MPRDKNGTGFLVRDACVVVNICCLCANESDYVSLNEAVMQLLVSVNYFKPVDQKVFTTDTGCQTIPYISPAVTVSFLH